MARRSLTVYYGSGFTRNLAINDGTNYNSSAPDLLAGPEITLMLQDTIFDGPYLGRTQIKERVFSIWFEPARVTTYSAQWHEKVRDAMTAMYNPVDGTKASPVRILVERGFLVNGVETTKFMYIEAVCEHITPLANGKEGFEAKFTAPDALFTLVQDNTQDNARLNNPIYDPSVPPTDGPLDIKPNVTRQQMSIGAAGEGQADGQQIYVPMSLPYDGTAPTVPIITFKIGGRGGVYRYYEEWTITNPSLRSLRDYPVCINLGDVRTNVDNAVAHGSTQGTIKFHETNHAGGDHRIKDIRLETLGGLRKNVYVRDSGEAGGTWHQTVKVWTILSSLAPGESKTLRVLYGNANASALEIYPDQSAIKMQMQGYVSDNDHWVFSDFAPTRDQPQTRSFQWSPYQPPGAPNLSPIIDSDKRFLNANGANVPGAGAKVLNTAPVVGSAGLKIALPLAVSRIAYDAQVATNTKTPLVFRWQHRNGQWEDGINGDGIHWNPESVWRTTLRSNYVYTGVTADDRVIPVTGIGTGGSVGNFVVGSYIHVPRSDSNSVFTGTITAINVASSKGTPNVQVSAPPTGTTWYANSGAYVQAAYPFSRDYYFAANAADPPAVVAFVLRGDVPTFNSGSWYYGAAEQVTVYFAAEEKLVLTRGGEVDISTNKYQLRGKFGNPNVGTKDANGAPTGEYLRINFITHNIYDMVVIDCKLRSCMYYKWDDTTSSYLTPENIFEALTFEQVRENYIHLEPLTDNRLAFVYDLDSNFRNNDLIVTYLTRFL